MDTDQLSEVLGLVEVRTAVSSSFSAAPPWVARGPLHHPLKFVAMARGRAVLSAGGADGAESTHALESGDFAILHDRSWLALRAEGEGPAREIDVTVARWLSDEDAAGADIVVGGHIDLDATGRALLSDALPPVGHVRASTAAAAHLRAGLDRLVDEMTVDRPGAAFAIRQYGQLLVLDMLRAYVDQTDLPAGSLRALTDTRLRPALSLMHAAPDRPWRLEELARAAAMSRTSFATHFTSTAGTPPLTYLHRWRMALARRALRDRDATVEALASDLGYASGSAFSTAFKREVGESPLRYRRRAREL